MKLQARLKPKIQLEAAGFNADVVAVIVAVAVVVVTVVAVVVFTLVPTAVKKRNPNSPHALIMPYLRFMITQRGSAIYLVWFVEKII